MQYRVSTVYLSHTSPSPDTTPLFHLLSDAIYFGAIIINIIVIYCYLLLFMIPFLFVYLILLLSPNSFLHPLQVPLLVSPSLYLSCLSPNSLSVFMFYFQASTKEQKLMPV